MHIEQHTFFVLKKLGFKKVRVYLGSWEEWGNKLELPVDFNIDYIIIFKISANPLSVQKSDITIFISI